MGTPTCLQGSEMGHVSDPFLSPSVRRLAPCENVPAFRVPWQTPSQMWRDNRWHGLTQTL